MEYQGVASQYYYNHSEVQLANASYDPNSYFVSSMSSHVDVASCNDTTYLASANTFDNAPHYTHHNYKYYGQQPMSTANSLASFASLKKQDEILFRLIYRERKTLFWLKK